MKNFLLCCLAAAFAPLGTPSARAGLVADWTADNYTAGDSTWTDSSGNGHTATAVGSLTTTANAFNGHAAINFAGGTTTGYFTVANDTSTLVGTTALTLAAVIRPTAAGTSVGDNFYNKAGLIGNEQGSVVNDWSLGFAASQLVLGIGNPDTTLTSQALALNQSYVAISVWDTSGTLRLYVNGTQVAQMNSGATDARDANETGTFALGASSANPGGSYVFTGQVAELRIYNDASQNITALTNSLAATYGIAVPEPSTWAAVALTFAAAGWTVLRRRRRSPAA